MPVEIEVALEDIRSLESEPFPDRPMIQVDTLAEKRKNLQRRWEEEWASRTTSIRRPWYCYPVRRKEALREKLKGPSYDQINEVVNEIWDQDSNLMKLAKAYGWEEILSASIRQYRRALREEVINFNPVFSEWSHPEDRQFRHVWTAVTCLQTLNRSANQNNGTFDPEDFFENLQLFEESATDSKFNPKMTIARNTLLIHLFWLGTITSIAIATGGIALSVLLPLLVCYLAPSLACSLVSIILGKSYYEPVTEATKQAKKTALCLHSMFDAGSRDNFKKIENEEKINASSLPRMTNGATTP